MDKMNGAEKQTRRIHFQNRHPNYYHGETFCLVRCFACNPAYGKENYAIAVTTGKCAWCGWKENAHKADDGI